MGFVVVHGVPPGELGPAVIVHPYGELTEPNDAAVWSVGFLPQREFHQCLIEVKTLPERDGGAPPGMIRGRVWLFVVCEGVPRCSGTGAGVPYGYGITELVVLP